MATAPAKPCIEPTCPHLRPCPQHPHVRHVYGAHHRSLREQLFTIQTCCQDCGAPGTPGDHADHKDARGPDVLSNLTRRCISCHSRKTVLMDGGFA
jgi:5-methylcytosine-specific restriction endonuclease McrA